jgi:hypothetical protein
MVAGCRKVLVNGETVHVGTTRDLSGLRTSRDLNSWVDPKTHFKVDFRFDSADLRVAMSDQQIVYLVIAAGITSRDLNNN